MMSAKTVRALCTLAVEYGVRQAEKGSNLQMAIKNYWDEQGPIPDFAYDVMPWRPIAELLGPDGKYDHINDCDAGYLLLAPELVDLDCNVHGVGMGFFQDKGREWSMTRAELDTIGLDPSVDNDCWLACKWSMSGDEWRTVPCTPTHYIRLTGART